jgi:hypothetical protein
MIQFTMIAKGDDKDSTNMHSKRIATVIKYYSMTILMIAITFVCFVGNIEKRDKPDSIDQ